MAPRAAWALVAAALATCAGGNVVEEGPRGLRCSKPCCHIHCKIQCSWEDPGAKSGAPATLHFCRGKTGHDCRSFKVGHSTSWAVLQDHVYARENSTVFVERPATDGQRSLRSEIRTYVLKMTVRFPPLEESEIRFGRTNTSLRLTWPETYGCDRSEQEVRFRPQGVDNWTQGNCGPGRNDGIGNTAEVLCFLDEDVPYEVQARHRISHWSSPWSKWSAAVTVPRAIARSPTVNLTAGRLRGDGTRNVTLEWERLGPDYGEVNFTLTFDLLHCRGCVTDWVTTVSGRTSFEADLSGAAYNISLQAANKAGGAPVSSVLLPPAQEAGPIVLNVSVSGPRFTARWRAPLDAIAFCFESHALGESPPETPCTDQYLEAGNVYENLGTLQPNQCYHLAVHGVAEDSGRWSTFESVHVFHRNASLEVPVRLEVLSAGSHWARVRWEPPRALSGCPGAAKKYILCCRKDGEPQTETAYYEANASSRELTFRDLDPQAAYLAGVWFSTGEEEEEPTCQPHVLFATLPDSQQTALALSFLSLGIFVAFLMAASGFHFSKKRIWASLWPPLPDPSGTEAVKILPALGQGQMHRPWVMPLEARDPPEPFVVVKGEGGEEGEGGDGGGEEKRPLEKGVLLEEAPAPPEYKSQGLPLLGPPEEEEGGEGPPNVGNEGPQADLG
nr:PREDICTED: interleukin-12 receptor subunit beta-1 [Anolis carolinensis]|eukprot:XP_008123126.1 PREDICTED: interleukin-12 receptor subunit beta-1 [Anolis carolinensis]